MTEPRHTERPSSRFRGGRDTSVSRPETVLTGGGVSLADHATATADPSPAFGDQSSYLSEMDMVSDAAVKVIESWEPMDTARQDGKPVWLSDGNGHVVEAFWRVTRKYKLSKLNGQFISRWIESGVWAVYNGGGQAVAFEPRGWRPSTGAPHP